MRNAFVSAIVICLATTLVTAQGVQEFQVDSATTTVLIQVGRSGVLSFAGHEHEVAAAAVGGRISFDSADVSRSRVTLEFDATALKVTGRGEPAADVPEVQRVMLSDRVLDVQRYPTITFESARLVVEERRADGFRLRIDGRLTLHGTTAPVSVPVTVRLAGNRLTATGQATVRQSAFGIRPVTAGAGTVRVKDDVTVAFTIAATTAAR